MRSMLKSIWLVMGWLLLSSGSAACAAKAGPAEFAERFESPSISMDLQGVALKKFLNIKVFAAGFYLPMGFSSREALEDVPKRIEVAYLQPIPQKELARVTIKGIAQNVDPEVLQKLEQQIDKMNAIYQDVRPGDRYAITYIPGQGTRVAFNGQMRGTIEGADFAQAFFSIWVGKKPVDDVFRARLLGEKK